MANSSVFLQAQPRTLNTLSCALTATLCLSALPSFAADETVLISDSLDSDDDTTPYRLGDVISDEHSSFAERFELKKRDNTGQSLSQILATAPGTQHRSTGGFGSYSDLRLRGSSAAQVNVYLDGMPLNDASFGSVNFATIDLLQLERAEVFRGSAPLQAGSSGLGGVVSLTSQRSEQPQSTVQLAAGSFGERQFAALHSGGQQAWRYLASINHHSADNDFRFLNDNGTVFNPFDDQREPRYNAQARQDSGLFKLSYQGDNWRLDNQLHGYALDKSLPNYNNTPSADATLDTRYALVQSRLSGQLIPASDWQLALGVHAGHKREAYRDRNSQIGLGEQDNRYTTRSAGLELYGEYFLAQSTHSLQLTLEQQRYTEQDLIDTEQPRSDKQQQRLRLNWQWSQFSADERWLLNPQLALEQQRLSVTGGDTDKQDGISAQLGLSYRLNPHWQLKSNLAALKRQPSLFERFGDRGTFRGNTDLRAETALNADLGWVFTHQAQALRSASVVAFVSEKDDLIATIYDSRGIGRPENISQGHVTGLELSSLWQHGRWSANTQATWQRAINQSQVASFNGKDLPSQPRWQLDLSLNYTLTHWRLSYQFQHQRDGFYDSLNRLPISEKRQHDLSAQYQYGANELSLALRNLGNAQHEAFNGYPTPGRSFHLSLKRTW